MTRPTQSEALASMRADSLARRPAASIAAPDANDRFKVRAKLNDACVVPIDRLIPDPDQPRKTFEPESIDRLSESLASVRGQLVPILVRWAPEPDGGRFIIVDGERRYRAALKVGLATMKAIDVTGLPDDEVLDIQIVINFQREEVPPMEQARAFERLMAAAGCTQLELADRLKIDNTAISRALSTLRKLPEPILASVDDGSIGLDVAYQLTKFDDPAEQAELADRARAGDLPRDEIRAAVAKSKAARIGGPAKGKARKSKPPKTTERTIRTAGGPKVTVEWRRGLDPASIALALEQALTTIRTEVEDPAA